VIGTKKLRCDFMWEINFGLLRKAIDLGHCLCDLGKKCPCDEFIDNHVCQCGVYKKVK